MPPAKPKHHLIRDWIKPFPEGIYTTDGKIIFCQPCGKKIQCSIKSHLTQHNESDKHSENFERFQKTATRQQFLAFSQTENVDPFSKDLCNALVGANIPFYKVNNPGLSKMAEIAKVQNGEEAELEVETMAPKQCLLSLQSLFNKQGVAHQLAYIQCNFSILPKAITKLESQGLTLSQNLEVLAEVKTAISNAGGHIGQKIQTKLDSVMRNNPGLSKMTEIAKVQNGEEAELEVPKTRFSAPKNPSSSDE
ncbi:hypothetical protein DdX_20417 [Ditylenchus destructor]|uniref:Uncharacterized protein n=1 Tax=Ditylenchus destructor TaxID=166010 RepID=A0AAD4MIQ4_9BILA|nr:hypothetical protein DdX_20417 [Ditylenchus destructor]